MKSKLFLYDLNGNSNLHTNVNDEASFGNTDGFTDGNTNPALDDYEYDANGNMTRDRNKGIENISYNHLNLPVRISFDIGRSIQYTYNAAGQKVGKLVEDNGVYKPVEYLDGFQYAGEVLQFFPHPEGYVDVLARIVDGKPYTYRYKYVYNYTDHLGNIRMSYTLNPQNNKLEILEENHYFPFGLKHSTYIPADKKMLELIVKQNEEKIKIKIVQETEYQYKYNGKEWQDELGLNVYAYGGRDYDPATARFNKIDRFADKYYSVSPYAYAANNPVRFMDVKGDSLWIEHKGNKILYENGNLKNKDGSAYAGKGVKIGKDGSVKLKGFLKKATAALDKLSSKDIGNAVVDQLQGSSENYTVVKSNSGNYYNSGTNEVGFDPSSKNGGLDRNGNTGRPTFVGIGHELGHSVDDDNGTLDRTVDFSFGYRNTEKFATHIENQIRSEHGLSLRTHYGQDASGNWNGPLLKGNTNESLHYPGFIYGGVTPLSIQPAGLSMPMSVPQGNVLPTINRIP